MMITRRSFFADHVDNKTADHVDNKTADHVDNNKSRTKRPEYLAADERILSLLVHSFVNNPNQDVILFLRGLAHNFLMS
jgi:hypothetical protein